MKCVVLAAGYATRLYPLTENFPKPLLAVGNKTILDHLLDDLADTGVIDEYIIVSNHKFADVFKKWIDAKDLPVLLIDDMTESNETRLGAVRDIALAVEKIGANDDILFIGGDNLLDFSLSRFVSYINDKNTSCVMRYSEPSREKLKHFGVLEVDADDRVIGMTEKSPNPKTNWVCPPFYFYKKEDAALVFDALRDGCKTDAPGSFVAWLCTRRPIHAMEMPGARYDIGDIESYKEVRETYRSPKS